MSSPWKKQPEDVVDSVLKRAEVSKVSEGMQDGNFLGKRRRNDDRNPVATTTETGNMFTQRLTETFL